MATIDQSMDNLPTGGVTVMALRALDFVAPGQWNNIVGFDNMIQQATGETDPDTVALIRSRALELFNDPNQGYQRALWIYQTVDSTDKVLGGASLAHQAGERFRLLSFLDKITPSSDTTQTVDLCVKLTAELTGFCYTNGLPGDSISDFVQALGAYEGDNLIRMAALVCFDGLIPLGPDFLTKVFDVMNGAGSSALENNATFQRLKDMIPGGNTDGQFSFMGNAFESVQGWIGNFISERGITSEGVISNLRNYVEVADDKLDLIAGFLDVSTDYFAHTGTQSLARSLATRAVGEI